MRFYIHAAASWIPYIKTHCTLKHIDSSLRNRYMPGIKWCSFTSQRLRRVSICTKISWRLGYLLSRKKEKYTTLISAWQKQRKTFERKKRMLSLLMCSNQTWWVMSKNTGLCYNWSDQNIAGVCLTMVQFYCRYLIPCLYLYVSLLKYCIHL